MPNPENRGKVIGNEAREPSTSDMLEDSDRAQYDAILDIAEVEATRLGRTPSLEELIKSIESKAHQLGFDRIPGKFELNMVSLGIKEIKPERAILQNGVVLPLTFTEYHVLRRLTLEANFPVTLDEFNKDLKDPLNLSALNMQISRIRGKMRLHPNNLKITFNRIKRGYVLEKVSLALPLDPEQYPQFQNPAA